MSQVVWNDRGDYRADQDHSHQPLACSFAEPVCKRVNGESSVDGGQRDQGDKVEREHDTTTQQQDPEADTEQSNHQLLAVPPADDQVEDEGNDTEDGERSIALEPVMPTGGEITLVLTSLYLIQQRLQHAQMLVMIPGEMPGIR